MITFLSVSAITASSLLAPGAFATDVGDRVREAYADRADAGMVRGASVAVISQDGSSSKFVLGDIHSPQELLEIGSVSKTFAAIAIAELANEKQIGLDTPISTYVPELKNAFIGKTTAHLLATHMSQLPDGYPGEDQTDETGLIHFLQSYIPTSNYAAGVRQYSNTGFATLSLIISRISGMSYEDYIQKKIFSPLSMNKSGFLNSPNNSEILVTPHNMLLQQTNIDTFGTVEQAAGGIYSNADDMAKFVAATLHPESVPPLKEAIILSETLGLGWDSLPGIKPLWKNGGMTGFGSLLEIDVDQNQGAFTVVNNNNTIAAMSICDLALNGAANDQIWNVDQFIAGPKLSNIDSFIGTYTTPDQFIEINVQLASDGFLGINVKEKGVYQGVARLISVGSQKFLVDTVGGLKDVIEISLDSASSAASLTYFEMIGTGPDGKPKYKTTGFTKTR